MINEAINELNTRMNKCLDSLKRDFNTIRTGRANPSLLDNVSIDYFGNPSKISHVAAISVQDAHTLTISPWDKGMIQPIEKAISNASLGLNPNNDGDIIRISIPSLTQDRRLDLVRQAKKFAEDSKISIRNVRRDTNEHLKKCKVDGDLSEEDLKKALDQVQKATDSFIVKVDQHTSEKEVDITTV